MILATNEDLAKAVAEGRFRQDLFYRINVINVELPPLARADLRHPAPGPALSPAGVRGLAASRRAAFRRGRWRALQRYPWPGNVRELQNVIERAVLLGKGESIGLDDLPGSVMAAGPVCVEPLGERTLKEAMDDPERQIILDVLEANQWNRQLTAETWASTAPRSTRRCAAWACNRRGRPCRRAILSPRVAQASCLCCKDTGWKPLLR